VYIGLDIFIAGSVFRLWRTGVDPQRAREIGKNSLLNREHFPCESGSAAAMILQ
jgi:hypothetical protein